MTLLPATLLGLVSLVIAFFALMFLWASMNQFLQRCNDCVVPYRAGQFALLSVLIGVALAAVAATQALVAFGIWRGSRLAVVAGVVVSAIGAVVCIMAKNASIQLAVDLIAAAYAVAGVLLVVRLFRSTRESAGQ